MARYYFDLKNNEDLERDNDGIECRTLSDVRRSALTALAEVVYDEVPDGDAHQFAMMVRDEKGAYVFQAQMSLSSNWIG